MKFFAAITSLSALFSAAFVAAAPHTPLHESGIHIYLRETGRGQPHWHFGVALRMPNSLHDQVHEHIISVGGFYYDTRTTEARNSYPVEGPIYAAGGETDVNTVKQHVEQLIASIPQGHEPHATQPYQNCLDCTYHAFNLLQHHRYINPATWNSFLHFYNQNRQTVMQTTHAHTMNEAAASLQSDSSSSDSGSSGHSSGHNSNASHGSHASHQSGGH